MASTQRSHGGTKNSGFEDAAAGASKAVRQAAAVLEKELAVGLTGVRRLEEQFREDRQVDQAAFDEVLQSLRTNAHEFVSVASSRMAELRAEDVQDLTERFTTHAQDLLDTVINLVALGPDILNRLASRDEGAIGEAPVTTKRTAKGATTPTATRRAATKTAAKKSASSRRSRS